MSSRAKKISVSLPSGLVDQLDLIADRLGVSRSAFLTAYLNEGLPALVSLVEGLPTGGDALTEADAQRFRGKSAQLIRDMVAKLIVEGGQNDLFQ